MVDDLVVRRNQVQGFSRRVSLSFWDAQEVLDQLTDQRVLLTVSVVDGTKVLSESLLVDGAIWVVNVSNIVEGCSLQ